MLLHYVLVVTIMFFFYKYYDYLIRQVKKSLLGIREYDRGYGVYKQLDCSVSEHSLNSNFVIRSRPPSLFPLFGGRHYPRIPSYY